MLKTRFIDARYEDGTMIDQNQLATALLTTPHVERYLSYAFGTSYDGYSILQMLTGGVGAIRGVQSNEVQWALMGRETKAVEIIGASTPAPAAFPGINFTEFMVTLKTKYFVRGDTVLFGGGHPDMVLARVIRDPQQATGEGWCYYFQIMGDNPNQFVPARFLRPNESFVSWVGNAFGEFSEGGGIKMATPMMFKNQLGIYRMAAGMSGSAKTDILQFQFKTGKNERKAYWLYKQQKDLTSQFMKALERSYWLGKYNKLPNGTIPQMDNNGYPVISGSGIEELIAGSNTFVTQELTETLLREVLLGIAPPMNPAEAGKRILITGKGGIDAFDKAMKRAARDLGSLIIDSPTWIDKKTGNELSFGRQFTTYRGLYGAELSVVDHPLFNDEETFPEKHPVTNFTLQSYKMFILDFSGYDGERNIELLAKEANGESRYMMQWFTAGSTTPKFSSTGSSGVTDMLRSNGLDGFTMYMLSESGLLIRNPLSCAMIQINPPA